MIVLGLHGGVTLGQHEPAAALSINGRIVALCEEERYLRIKSCYGYLPEKSIQACLDIAGIGFEEIDLIVTPGVTYDDFRLRWHSYLSHLYGSCPKIECINHQQAHVAAAFYGSGLEESLCLSLDASGDGLGGMVAYASKATGIKIIEEIPNSNSLGFFYTLMTYYCGFADGDEYKLMGLAPYGKPVIDLQSVIRPVSGGWEFESSFIRNKPSLKSPFEPQYSEKLGKVLGNSNRQPKAEMSDFYRNVAASTQAQMEACLLSLIASIKQKNPTTRSLCYSGGVALNCSANRLLIDNGLFENVYVSPVASDRGLALGCAYVGAVMLGDNPWPIVDAYLGSSYTGNETEKELKANGISYREVEDPAKEGAKLLAQKKIIGWHQGRSEAGARALGNRSILASCADTDMRDLVNARIKYREEFRPFAPAILQEEVSTYFDTNGIQDFPYMTFTLNAHQDKAKSIGAVVHVDSTARVQTVRSSNNEIYYDLIKNYSKESGQPVIMNTSFNLKGQPIVETPRDAIMTFYGCGLDALFIGNYLIEK